MRVRSFVPVIRNFSTAASDIPKLTESKGFNYLLPKQLKTETAHSLDPALSLTKRVRYLSKEDMKEVIGLFASLNTRLAIPHTLGLMSMTQQTKTMPEVHDYIALLQDAELGYFRPDSGISLPELTIPHTLWWNMACSAVVNNERFHMYEIAVGNFIRSTSFIHPIVLFTGIECEARRLVEDQADVLEAFHEHSRFSVGSKRHLFNLLHLVVEDSQSSKLTPEQQKNTQKWAGASLANVQGFLGPNYKHAQYFGAFIAQNSNPDTKIPKDLKNLDHKQIGEQLKKLLQKIAPDIYGKTETLQWERFVRIFHAHVDNTVAKIIDIIRKAEEPQLDKIFSQFIPELQIELRKAREEEALFVKKLRKTS